MQSHQREGSEAGSDILVGPANHQPIAEVRNGRYLCIKLGREKLESVLLPEDDQDDDDDLDANSDGNADGPNARGTYSKDYVSRHPEIKWVHRGQGRYLPVGAIKKPATVERVRRSRYVALRRR